MPLSTLAKLKLNQGDMHIHNFQVLVMSGYAWNSFTRNCSSSGKFQEGIPKTRKWRLHLPPYPKAKVKHRWARNPANKQHLVIIRSLTHGKCLEQGQPQSNFSTNVIIIVIINVSQFGLYNEELRHLLLKFSAIVHQYPIVLGWIKF